jgi:ATP-dependent protease ClpP protease subunit
MDIGKLKHVVGKVEKGAPAFIRFFDTINQYSTQRFNEEFLWLQNYIVPSKIIVLINSEGGSVLYGMSTFSIIQSCPIETDCVIEGIAASMGSVLWAAGDNLYMHDYSILMIHNPFLHDKDNENEDIKNMVNAFRKQLEVIYQKRFGLSKKRVQEIMDGEGDATCTYFSADEAVSAGILSASNILKTSKHVFEKIRAQIEGITNVKSLRDIMTLAIGEVDENKLIEKIIAICYQNDQEIQEQKLMENKDSISYGAVIAQLGLATDTPVTSVFARLTELMQTESELKEVKSQLGELQVQFAGKEAEVKIVSDELANTKATLKGYQEAEQAAIRAEIASVIDAAIKEGKIEESAKDSWLKMAESNLELVKNTLGGIPARDKISKQIANDSDNVKNAQETMKTAEQKMIEKVTAVVGDLKLKTF